MRTFVSFFLMLIMVQKATSQLHEIGVIAGGSNYIGDIGATDYIAPNTIALGLLYKWNTSARYSYRASLMYAALQGIDSKSDIAARQDRNYEFKNTVKEISAGMEFNFLDFNLHHFGVIVTPYIHSGLSYFSYDALYFDTNETIKYNTRDAFAIPMALGIKSNIVNYIVIGLEVNVRYTFTDHLDGSNPPESELNNFRFGNLNSNDWYVFSGVTITYTFGRNPCYCAE
jgi:Domain of unknown function (DUF6089)